MTTSNTPSPIDNGEAVGLLLSIHDIVPFDKDPRRSPNSEYARIKSSIRAQGLDQPLVVTRRPGVEHYLIAAGGNTRLKILRELSAESHDLKFAQVACLFKAWQGESEVMLAHLRENDLRGGLSFLDKARAVLEVRRMVESEQGQVALTQGVLTEVLRTRGYALSQTTVSLMEYGVEILEARLPLALGAGLALGDVRRIRLLETAARTLWHDRVLAQVDTFDEVFAQLCRRFDCPDWDFLSLREAVEAEIADRLNQTVHAVRLALDARIRGGVEDALPQRTEEDEWPAPPPLKPRLKSVQSEPSSTEPSATQLEAARDVTHADNAAVERETREGDEWSDPLDDVESDALNPLDTLEIRQAPRTDIAAMRAALAALATALATRHGLGSLVFATPEVGLGYLVADAPEPALLEQFDEAGLALVSMIWWQLISFAEMTVAPIEYLLPHLSPTCVLYRALRDQDAGLLFNAVWTLDPGQVGFRLWRPAGDEDCADLLAMTMLYRKLHRAAESLHVAVWQALA